MEMSLWFKESLSLCHWGNRGQNWRQEPLAETKDLSVTSVVWSVPNFLHFFPWLQMGIYESWQLLCQLDRSCSPLGRGTFKRENAPTRLTCGALSWLLTDMGGPAWLTWVVPPKVNGGPDLYKKVGRTSHGGANQQVEYHDLFVSSCQWFLSWVMARFPQWRSITWEF